MKLVAIAGAIAFGLLAFDASPANAGLFDFIGSLLGLAPPPVPVGRLTIMVPRPRLSELVYRWR
jgi:hypothetical protein